MAEVGEEAAVGGIVFRTVERPAVSRSIRAALPSSRMAESDRTEPTERADSLLRVRLAEPRDAHAIAVVGDAAWRVAYRGLVPDVLIERLSVEARIARRERADSRRRTWVVELGGRVVAYSRAGLAREPDPPPTRGEIDSLYVHPGSWRQGCARALLLRVLADLASAGFEEVVLWCLTENAAARAFYERMGFAVEAERVKKSFDGFPLDHARYRRGLEAAGGPLPEIPGIAQ
jgi:ribosomal protein S18 acetylase RimI-like enzyme